MLKTNSIYLILLVAFINSSKIFAQINNEDDSIYIKELNFDPNEFNFKPKTKELIFYKIDNQELFKIEFINNKPEKLIIPSGKFLLGNFKLDLTYTSATVDSTLRNDYRFTNFFWFRKGTLQMMYFNPMVYHLNYGCIFMEEEKIDYIKMSHKDSSVNDIIYNYDHQTYVYIYPECKDHYSYVFESGDTSYTLSKNTIDKICKIESIYFEDTVSIETYKTIDGEYWKYNFIKEKISTISFFNHNDYEFRFHIKNSIIKSRPTKMEIFHNGKKVFKTILFKKNKVDLI